MICHSFIPQVSEARREEVNFIKNNTSKKGTVVLWSNASYKIWYLPTSFPPRGIKQYKFATCFKTCGTRSRKYFSLKFSFVYFKLDTIHMSTRIFIIKNCELLGDIKLVSLFWVTYLKLIYIKFLPSSQIKWRCLDFSCFLE